MVFNFQIPFALYYSTVLLVRNRTVALYNQEMLVTLQPPEGLYDQFTKEIFIKIKYCKKKV